MLEVEGKGVVAHKPAISAGDMDKIQVSLDLDDPVGLQDKVFIDVMTLNIFEICEESGLGGKCYIASLTLKNTLTKTNVQMIN